MREARTFKRVLITGIAGSGGSYLAEYIHQHHPEVEVHGLARWHSTTQDNLHRLAGLVRLHEADLLDFAAVFNALRASRPDAVFHLAAHANVRASFTTPAAVLNNNIIGTTNLFEALRAAQLDPIIQLCSTSEVYGQVPLDQVPIKEDAPLLPASPYAVSKVAQDLLGRSYWVSYGMKIIRTRMFTYVNPRRTDLFATSFARQVARIEAGLQTELVHGNLNSVRTLIDVRDAMRAYWDTVCYCEPGEVYNIGGDTTLTVGDLLQELIRMARTPIPTRVDPNLLRPADVTLQIPDVTKFCQATDWTPKYSFAESIDYLLTHWRAQAELDSSRKTTKCVKADTSVAA